MLIFKHGSKHLNKITRFILTKIPGGAAVTISIIQRGKLSNDYVTCQAMELKQPAVAKLEPHSVHDIRLSPHVAG